MRGVRSAPAGRTWCTLAYRDAGRRERAWTVMRSWSPFPPRRRSAAGRPGEDLLPARARTFAPEVQPEGRTAVASIWAAGDVARPAAPPGRRIGRRAARGSSPDDSGPRVPGRTPVASLVGPKSRLARGVWLNREEGLFRGVRFLRRGAGRGPLLAGSAGRRRPAATPSSRSSLPPVPEHLVQAEHRLPSASSPPGRWSPPARPRSTVRGPTGAGPTRTIHRAAPSLRTTSFARSPGIVPPAGSSRRSTAPAARHPLAAPDRRNRPETRARRLEAFVQMLADGIHRGQVRALHLRGRDAGRRRHAIDKGYQDIEASALHRLRHRSLPGRLPLRWRGPSPSAPGRAQARCSPSPRGRRCTRWRCRSWLGPGRRAASADGRVPPVIEVGSHAPSPRAGPGEDPGSSSAAASWASLWRTIWRSSAALRRAGPRGYLCAGASGGTAAGSGCSGAPRRTSARPPEHRADEAVRRRDGHRRLAPAGRLPVLARTEEMAERLRTSAELHNKHGVRRRSSPRARAATWSPS